MINSRTLLCFIIFILIIYIIQNYRLYRYMQKQLGVSLSYTKMLFNVRSIFDVINILSGKRLRSMKEERNELGNTLKNIFNKYNDKDH